jgi:hypothetical protein
VEATTEEQVSLRHLSGAEEGKFCTERRENMGSLFIDCYRGLEAAIINRQTEFVERLMQMLLPIVLVVVGCLLLLLQG